MGLRTGGRRAKSLKNRVKSSKIELRFREVRSEGCTSCSPVQQALILPYYGFYGSASAEPFLFNRSFPADWGGTTAHIRRLRFLHPPLDKNCKRDYYTSQTDNGAWGVFTSGFFLWNVLGNASLRADRGGPQRKIRLRAAAEWCLPGRKEEKEKVL